MILLDSCPPIPGLELGPDIRTSVFDRILEIRAHLSYAFWNDATPLLPDFDPYTHEGKRYELIKETVVPEIEALPHATRGWGVRSQAVDPGKFSNGSVWHPEHEFNPGQTNGTQRWDWLAFTTYGPQVVCVPVEDGLSAAPDDLIRHPSLVELLTSDYPDFDENVLARHGAVIVGLVPNKWHRVNGSVWHRSIPNPFDDVVERTFISAPEFPIPGHEQPSA